MMNVPPGEGKESPTESSERTEQTQADELSQPARMPQDRKRAAQEANLDSEDEEDEQQEEGSATLSVDAEEGEEDRKPSPDKPEEEEEDSSSEDENYVLDQNRFPDKVRYLLDEQIAPDAIWWLPEGDALAVNRDAFSMQLLIRHFRGNKFSSVTRNFNRWGFRRVPDERVPEGVLGYTHDKFLRGRPGLLKKLKKEVYIKKEKDDKDEGGDKKQPRKKARTKGSPRKAPPSAATQAALGAEGPGLRTDRSGSLALQSQLSADLALSSAATANRADQIVPPTGAPPASLLQRYEQENARSMLGALGRETATSASSSLAQRLAILQSIGRDQHPLTAAEVHRLSAIQNSAPADAGLRLTAIQDSFPMSDAARLSMLSAGTDQMDSLQARRLAALQASTVEQPDPWLAMMASSRGQSASSLQPASNSMFPPGSQQGGLNSSAFRQLPGSTGGLLQNEDLLQRLSRQRQLDAHQQLQPSFPTLPQGRRSISSLDTTDPAVLRLLASHNRIPDSLSGLSNPSAVSERFGQDIFLRNRRSSQQLDASQLRSLTSPTNQLPSQVSTLTDYAGRNHADITAQLLQPQLQQSLLHGAMNAGEHGINGQMMFRPQPGGVHPRLGRLSVAGPHGQIAFDDEALRREQMERREEAKRGGL
ncbi:HSF-type DNA-binding [Seminavis robusta]|uniref:HSF-type DNA-binding n=1 Tax=Seminavis robusta TaxID=568900 RepID=A0A9N8DRC3_9STRA|nr:HSF-type DNA-binding [Seminavis robusta]|eukprot:Sro226_g092120.1 HSF-type DNA-binding (649) ;mRNA; r:77070-79254